MHVLIYNIFLGLYSLFIHLAAPWNIKARKWIAGRKGIFDKLETSFSQITRPVIWMHCASLGEFEQGRPLLEAIRKEYPGYVLILTFFSPSGYEIQKNYAGADHIFYLPIDSKINAVRLVKLINPALVIWIKYDYWFYYLSELKKKQIPVLLVSANFRSNQPFFRWYGRLHRWMLESFEHLFVQTGESLQLLQSIGLSKNSSVCGDTRFDRVIQIAGRFEPMEAIEAFCGNRPIIVAGSTWQDDDEELDHFANSRRQVRFLVAPHEIDEARIRETMQLFKFAIRYSEWIKLWEQGGSTETNMRLDDSGSPNVLVIDNIGMLSKLYRYASVCYIGGGFGNDGVHNVLEAAVYSKPVVFGPVYDKYVEASDLVESEAAFSVENALELEEVMDELIGNEKLRELSGKVAGDYVRRMSGATNKVMQYIQEKRLLTN